MKGGVCMVFLNQTIFDSLIDQIAVLDKNGYITAINKSWIDFSRENNGDLSKSGIGNNYLAVCPKEVSHGIFQVLKGIKEQFIFEYPCHNENEMRWFLLRVTPFTLDQDQNKGAVVSHVNITDRKLTELELKRNEQRYRLIAENSTDFISIHSVDGVYTYVSPNCYSLLGYESHEMLEQSACDFFHPDDIKDIKSSYDTVRYRRDISTLTYRIRCKDGKYIWFETKCQIVASIGGDCEEIICISHDITKHKRQLVKLEMEKNSLQKKIHIDELTGLFNRRYFNKKLKEEYKQSLKHNKIFSLLAIDIDYFKKYNDTYGHQQGDECLIQVANTLKAYASDTGFVCRTGGEEFCIILPNMGKKSASSLAEKLCEKVEQLKIHHNNSNVSPFVTVSIGVATAIGKEFSYIEPKKLLLLADQSLYKAKEDGRNQVNYQLD